jgi:protein TonB
MTLTTKNTPELNGPGKPGASSQSSAGKAGQSPRSNPVCLEVNVTIRSLPGEASGVTQPIREDGRTVIVFDNGAVLRSSNNMPAGLKVILSNPKGRDVVCQVVGGRNLPNVKGYVEVEFLEPVNDFWSIHQEVDGGTAAAPAPAAAPPAPREAVVPPPPVPAVAPRATAPMESPAAPVNTSLGSAPTVENVAGRAGMPAVAATRDLKSEPARPAAEKVSKLSSYYSFSETAKATSLANWGSSTSEPPVDKNKIPAKREVSSFASPPPAPSHDFLSKGLMAYEQPAETSGGSSGRVPIIVGVGALALAAACGVVFYLHRSTTPIPIANTVSVSQPATPGLLTENSAPAQAPPAEVAPMAAETQMQPQNVATDPAKAMDSVAPVPAVVTSPATSDSQKETRPDTKNARRAEKKEVVARQPEAAPTRRPIIPNLKMSSPSAPNQNLAKLGEASAPAADITSAATGGAVPPAGLLTSVGRISNPPAPPAPALAPASPAPAAPVLAAPAPAPAVKTVREPKLISSTRAVYPATARQSSIQGSVTVSASIDANGKVVAAKALSGPILLRQAAVDSVSQWKYSPGLIDGKPAPSQVNVSVEFRMN